MKITVRDFFKIFPNDDVCLQHIFDIRYGQGYECPKCNKSAKWYPIKAERAFSCQWCGNHLHPTVGTLFEKSRTSLQLWFYAIFLFTTTRHGVSGKELQRQLGVTYKCAWRMGHEIRKHMGMVDGDDKLSGNIEVDETYIGGKRPGKRGRGADGKTVVFGMIQRDGDVMTRVVDDAQRKTIEPIIKDNVDIGSTVNSDEWHAYSKLNQAGYEHQTVDHGKKEYVRGNCHVNSLEGFWSHLKNSIKSTHIHVSKKHMKNYLGEFEYRFNSRENPEGMFPELISTFVKKP